MYYINFVSIVVVTQSILNLATSTTFSSTSKVERFVDKLQPFRLFAFIILVVIIPYCEGEGVTCRDNGKVGYRKRRKKLVSENVTQAKLHHGHVLKIPTTTTVLRTSPDNSSIFGRHGCQQGNNRCSQKGNIQGFLFSSPGSSRS